MDKVAELESRQFKFSLKCVAIFWIGIVSGLIIDNNKLIGWFDSFVEVNQPNVTVVPHGMLSNTELLRKLRLYGVTLTDLDCSTTACQVVLPLPSSRRSQESLVHIMKSVFTEHFNTPINLSVITENDVLTMAISAGSGDEK